MVESVTVDGGIVESTETENWDWGEYKFNSCSLLLSHRFKKLVAKSVDDCPNASFSKKTVESSSVMSKRFAIFVRLSQSRYLVQPISEIILTFQCDTTYRWLSGYLSSKALLDL